MHHSSIRRWTLAALMASMPLLVACNTVRDVTAIRLSSDDDDGGGGDAELRDADGPGLDSDRPDLDASVDGDTSPSDVADDVLRDPDAVTRDVADEPDVTQDLADEPDLASEDVADEPDLPVIPTGPIALYTFEHGSGTTVLDRSEVAPAADLDIEGAALWVPGRDAIAAVGFARMISQDPPRKLFDRITARDELSVEAWVRPGRTDQRGPSRIVSYSEDGGARNFTLAQSGDAYVWRLRTVDSTDNGIPSLHEGSVERRMTHLIVTKGPGSVSQIYEDGVLVGTRDLGPIARWDATEPLVIANENDDRRPFVGEFYRVAVFDRQLHADEVVDRFDAGPAGRGPDGRIKVGFRDERVDVTEGEDVVLHLSATPHPAAPLEVQYIVDRGETDLTGFTGSATIGVGGGGTIQLHAQSDGLAGGPRSAVVTLVSGADYTTEGTVITEVRVEDPDTFLPATPVVWLSGEAHDRLRGEALIAWPNLVAPDAPLAAYNEPYFKPAAVGGHGAIQLKDSGEFYVLNEGFADLTGGLTVVVVAASTQVITNGHLVSFSNDPADDLVALRREGSGCDLVYEVADSDNVLHRLTAPDALCVEGGAVYAVRQGAGAVGELTDATLFVDDVAAVTVPLPVANSVVRSSLRLGHGPGTAHTGFAGQLAEVIIYDRALSDVELGEVQGYLKTKYYPDR